MNAYEQLLTICEELENNGANEASILLVEKFLKRAEADKSSSTSVPRAMMIKHLLKQKETIDSDSIFNDLQELLDGVKTPVDPDQTPYAWEEERRPKPKSYYKRLKEQENNSR